MMDSSHILQVCQPFCKLVKLNQPLKPPRAHSWTTREPFEPSLAPANTLRGRNKRQLKVLLRNEMAERIHCHEEPEEHDARGPHIGFFLDADQRQLTAKIRASNHARELHAHLVQAGPRVVNAIHVGLAFQKVAQLHPGSQCIAGSLQSQVLYSLLERLSNHAFHCSQSMSPMEIARILWACASLDFPLDPELVEVLMQRFLSLRHKWNSVDVANVAWSLPVLLPWYSSSDSIRRIDWLAPLVTFLVEGGEALPARTLVVVTNSLSKASIVYKGMTKPRTAGKPSISSLLSVGQVKKLASLLCSRISAFSPQDTVNALGALFRLGIKPEEHWMRVLTSHAMTQMRDFNCSELVLMTYALAKLKYRPPLNLMNAIYSSSALKLASCPRGMLSVLLWSVAELTENVGGAPSRWVDAILEELCERELCLPFGKGEEEEGGLSGVDEYGEGGGRAKNLAVTLYSLACLQHMPNEDHFRLLLAQLDIILTADLMGAREISLVSWAMAQFSRGFSSKQDVVSRSTKEYQEGSSVLPAPLQTKLAGAAVHDGRLLHFNDLSFSLFIWGAGHSMLQAAEGGRAPWVSDAGAEAFSRLERLDAIGLSQVMWAMGRLGFPADPIWCQRAERRAHVLLRDLTPEGLTSVIHSFSWLQYLPSIPFLTEYTDQVALKSAALSPEAHLGIARILNRFMARHTKAAKPDLPAVQMSRKAKKDSPSDNRKGEVIPIAPNQLVKPRRTFSLSFQGAHTDRSLMKLQESILSLNNMRIVPLVEGTEGVTLGEHECTNFRPRFTCSWQGQALGLGLGQELKYGD